MACLRKRSIGTGVVYDVDFTFNGKRYIRSTKTSDLRLAKEVLHDIEGKIARGKFDLASYKKKHVRVTDFFKDYLELARSYKGAQTLLNERTYIRKFVAFAGDINLDAVDARLMDRWKAHTLAQVSEVTFNIERRVLHAAFNVAVKWGIISDNPVKHVGKAKPQEKRLFMTEDELAQVFALIDEDIAKVQIAKNRSFLLRFKLLLHFLLNTGLRRGEALRIGPANVDLKAGVVHVERTKSKQTRIVPLNQKAREVLREAGESPFVGLNGEHVSRKFAQYLRRAALSGFKLHSLRHSFATILISRGVDLYTVSRLLGHADIRTSMIYAKARMDTLQEAVDRLELDSGK